MSIKNLLGKRIQEIRKSKNITQERLAELVGIDTSSISNIENGKYYPSSENLDKILTILNISPEELFVFSHFKEHSELIQEMVELMTNNKELTLIMYKFFKSVKF